MELATLEHTEICKSLCRILRGCSAYCKSYKYFVGMKSGIMVSEVIDLKVLYGLYYGAFYKVYAVINITDCLKRIEKKS